MLIYNKLIVDDILNLLKDFPEENTKKYEIEINNLIEESYMVSNEMQYLILCEIMDEVKKLYETLHRPLLSEERPDDAEKCL